MREETSRRSAVVALGITVVIWAYSWIVMKQVLRYAGPFDFAAIRYTLGAALLFSVLLVTRSSLRAPPLIPTIIVGLSQTAAFQGLGQLALVSGGAGHVALLAYAMPFWAVLLAWVLLHERPTRRHVLGLVLAATGLICVIEPWQGLGSAQSTFFALAGGACWALGTVMSKRVFQTHNPSPLTFTAWQMLFGAMALIVVALCVPQRAIDWSAPFLAGLAYSVILASSVAWGLWLVVVKRLSTAVASVSSLAVPVTSVLMAWAILGERPTLMEGVGIAFILAGLVAVTGVRLRRARIAG
ncbi:drug/metabolite transporter (DMT)-like permease [Luteibacter sp. Sphag1AF]|uniref:DMT family transporter n=1 Tax=Luteibacter sp. Sphag1AF TaxID=2587031 RepID=UPI00161FDAF7|nr:EamA family transporter [Luteibacter sp. Sphag1AF]MBB3228009.1 drug/metabolite transporter (DMT)-like permease [Luteibacter sp. Sphag1AF]